jgi:hypothetical protein
MIHASRSDCKVSRSVYSFFAEHQLVELLQHGLVKAFTDAVRLQALDFGLRMVDVVDRQIKLVVVTLCTPTVLRSTVGQYSQQRQPVLLVQRQHAVVEQVSRHDRRFRRVRLRLGHLAVGVDERLLVNSSNALERAHVERLLGTEVARLCRVDFTSGFVVLLFLLQRLDLRLGEYQPFDGDLRFQRLEPVS